MIARDSLLSLEAYARQRNEFRAKVIEHKKRRNVHLGEHVMLQFEDELTIRYQVQEMLRIERIFEDRSEEHTSELQSQSNLVCRLLLEKKKKQNIREGNQTSMNYNKNRIPYWYESIIKHKIISHLRHDCPYNRWCL